jgi:hypothetical protein
MWTIYFLLGPTMPSESSPTSRALLALEALQDSPGITADRLGRRLGVTSRAARRYVEILREADIPVESVRGPDGGYRLGRGVRPPPLRFGSDEALGLVMAALDGQHDAADDDGPVGRALSKLLGALPRSVAAQADAVRRTAAPVPSRCGSRSQRTPSSGRTRPVASVDPSSTTRMSVRAACSASSDTTDGRLSASLKAGIRINVRMWCIRARAAVRGLGS